jgi:hypothetical protein
LNKFWDKIIDIVNWVIIIFVSLLLLVVAVVFLTDKVYWFWGLVLLGFLLVFCNWVFPFKELFRGRTMNIERMKTIASSLILIAMIILLSIFVLRAPRYIYIPYRGSFLVSDIRKTRETGIKTRIDWDTVVQHSIPVVLIGGVLLWVFRKKK